MLEELLILIVVGVLYLNFVVPELKRVQKG